MWRISFYVRVSFVVSCWRVLGTIKRQLREREREREANDYNNESRGAFCRHTLRKSAIVPARRVKLLRAFNHFLFSSFSCLFLSFFSFLTRDCLSLLSLFLFLISSSIFSCSSLWRYRGQRVWRWGRSTQEQEDDSFFDMRQGFVRYTTMTFICQSLYAMHSE